MSSGFRGGLGGADHCQPAFSGSLVCRVDVRPPGPLPVSYTITWHPDLARRDAQVSPEIPAPTTATRRGSDVDAIAAVESEAAQVGGALDWRDNTWLLLSPFVQAREDGSTSRRWPRGGIPLRLAIREEGTAPESPRMTTRPVASICIFLVLRGMPPPGVLGTRITCLVLDCLF